MNARTRSLILGSILVGVGASIGAAQVPAYDPNLVYLQLTVTDRNGRFVTGLPTEAFKITEDNAPQDIVYFSGKDLPVTAALLADIVDSDKKRLTTEAMDGLITNSGLYDRILLAEAGNAPPNEALYQALHRVLQLPDNATRAVILLTNRRDPTGYSFSKVRELLKDQDIRLYVIGVWEPTPNESFSTGEAGRGLFRDLATSSGGNSYFPTSTRALENIYKTVGSDLRNQYMVGYRPSNSARDGKWRKIKVTAEFPNNKLSVRSKQGYYAPTSAASAAGK